MRELVTEALAKFEEVIIALDRLEQKAGGWTVEEHNNFVIWSAQMEEIKQSIIDYACRLLPTPTSEEPSTEMYPSHKYR